MKKAIKAEDDDLRPEYDFSKLKGAVRGKYFKRYQAGVTVRYIDVGFEFLSAEYDSSIYRGEVVVRPDAMVLDFEAENQQRYSIKGRPKDGFYEGRQLGNQNGTSVEAKWTRLDDIWIGVWVEGGIDYLFTFRLASAVEPRDLKKLARNKRITS